jgi:hypothetical protein
MEVLMRKSKLDTPHVKEKVVKQLAAGESQNSISKEIGLNHSQVSRWSRREDIKELLEEEQKRLLSATPDAVGNFIELVPKDNLKARELQLKASEVILKCGGIIPTVHSQTLNMYQDNRQLISPNIMAILNSKFDEITGIDEDQDLIST